MMAGGSASADRGDVSVKRLGSSELGSIHFPIFPIPREKQAPLHTGDPVKTNDPCADGCHANSRVSLAHARSSRSGPLPVLHSS